MSDAEKFDDPIWDYVLMTKLQPYLPAVRRFWQNIGKIKVMGTGVHKVDDNEAPPGLFYRVTNTPVRSPIKNVQVFPFVPVPYLQITNVAGGIVHMVQRVCMDNRMCLEEFVIIEKSGLPTTYHNSQFVAFIPRNVLAGTEQMGKWVYLTVDEMIYLLAREDMNKQIREKLIKYV